MWGVNAREERELYRERMEREERRRLVLEEASAYAEKVDQRVLENVRVLLEAHGKGKAMIVDNEEERVLLVRGLMVIVESNPEKGYHYACLTEKGRRWCALVLTSYLSKECV